MNNILEATLQIKDKNMIWDNKVQEKIFKKRKSLFYSATYTHKPEFCTVCGCVSQNNNIVKNGTKTSRITLCSVLGLPAYLNLRKQRFLCRECGSSFTADTSRIVEKYCHISKRLNHYIIYLSICVLMNLNLLNLPIVIWASLFVIALHTSWSKLYEIENLTV